MSAIATTTTPNPRLRPQVRASTTALTSNVNAKRFFAAVRVGDQRFGGGEGRSKKQAEQAAARLAWEALKQAGAEEALNA